MKKLFIPIFFACFSLVSAVSQLSYNQFILFANNKKEVVFAPSFKFYTQFLYPEGETSIIVGGNSVISTIEKCGALNRFQYVDIKTQLYGIGLHAGIADNYLHFLELPLKNIVRLEEKSPSRFFHLGFSVPFPQITGSAAFDWYWGKAAFGSYDFGAFIGKPVFEKLSAFVWRMHASDYYRFTLHVIQVNGEVQNTKDEPFLFADGQIITANNRSTLYANNDSCFSAGFGFFSLSAKANIHLTAKNQGYFLFPYSFYNRQFLLESFGFGCGFEYSYTRKFFGVRIKTDLYSVIASQEKDALHSKEKKNFLFKGKEVKQEQIGSALKNTHLLVFTASGFYRINEQLTVSWRKIIPIPLLPKKLQKQLPDSQIFPENLQNKRQGLPVDFILSGLSFYVTLQL
ncbi:hypothetical protein HMPREF9554_00746 [Treponema phagedenis F0421]|uniref:hypothetical protein n=1 Tax=Treponema phagedenis TaxID=162 RepID=UPI0001F63AE8|nr:hypothetical protein [Treponema phagedenis]EFW38736.1 hypothetical protein HMPREF9554_00746 [Treponema phagedenis F0421]